MPNIGTVYGCEIKWQPEKKMLVTGTLETFDGVNKKCVSVAKSNATGYYYTVFKTSGVEINNSKLLCNVLKNNGTGTANLGNIYVTSNSYLVGVLQDQTLTTKALVDAWLEDNNVQIYYGLPTPIEYDLSDLPEIDTLNGVNNVWVTNENGTIKVLKAWGF